MRATCGCGKDDYDPDRWEACYNCRNFGTPTRVVNRNVELYDVYIGRPSKWGNPFKPVDRTEEARQRTITLYAAWIVLQTELMASLHELKGKRLGCYCKPKSCHGDVLIQLVNIYC